MAATLTEVSGCTQTDAGMHALWAPEHFGAIVDYESWDATLGDDDSLHPYVRAGLLVPISLGDGAWQFVVRIGTSSRPAVPTDREADYLVVASEPYLLLSSGLLYLGGLEHVAAHPGEYVLRVRTPPGRYEVTVHLIEWASEPGARTTTGHAAEGALPDLVVLLNPTEEERDYRDDLDTFPPPPNR
jgi:hypothetical protein